MPLTSFSGTLNTSNWRLAAAAAGQYYIASTPTPGTGVLAGTVVAFSATADGLFTISNNNPVGGRIIQLDQLKLQLSTPSTATTVMKMAAFNETGIVAPSAGNVAVVGRNSLNTGPATGAVINAFVSAMATIPAAVGTRTLTANWSVATSLGITGDEYTMVFGGDPVQASYPNAARATACANIVVGIPPITIAPQNTCILDWWWVGQATNGPTFEYFLSWLEFQP